MKKILTAGVLLGLIVAVWDFIYGFAGLYKSMVGALLFIVVAILIQVGVLIWGLKQTVKDGRRYWGQVGAGVLICLIGGILIIFASFAFTATFPDVFDVTAEMQADGWSQRGMSDDEIDAMLERTAATRTPWYQALMGFVGNMITGFIISLIAAAAIRVKD